MARRLVLAAVAIAAVVAAVVAVPALLDDADDSAAAAPPVEARPTAKQLTVIREPDQSTLGAVAVVPDVVLYEGPDADAPMFSLPNPTHEGVPLTFSLLQREGDRYLARLPIRPNGSTAWIDAADVQAHLVNQHIVVDISDRMLTLFHGETVVMEEPVAVGSDATPTPLGDFYIDISLDDPGGPYGDHMLSVAGFSDVLTDFGGGIGQIAIHGWNDPSVMGQAVSNGCVRMPNGVITHLAEQAGVGTPVHIQA
ncbi:MAG: L,D-transpeptidase [Actinomycetota bacterium]